MIKSLAALLAVAAVAGCTATPKPQSGAGPTSTTDSMHQPTACDSSPTQEEVLAFKAPKANKPYTIALMEVSLAGYYYQGNVYGAQQAAKDAGVTLTTVAGQGYASPALQVSQVDSVMSMGPCRWCRRPRPRASPLW